MREDRTYFWDIETSRIVADDGDEMQVTFLSNVVEMNCETGEIISSNFFRTIESTVKYFHRLNDVIIWSHNLDYELSFLLRELGCSGEEKEGASNYGNVVQDIIMRDKNAPLQVRLEILPDIVFRDSYALFNKGVADLGKEFNFPKLDYDYDVVRMPWDDLQQHDYDYNERDNLIVAKALYNYMITHEYKVSQIPLTFTGETRRARKRYIKENFGKKAINKFYFDRNKYKDDFEFFEDMCKVYQGGLTTSCKKHTGHFIDNQKCSGLKGVDIKSSYPNQMCTKKFPFFSKSSTVSLIGKQANEYFQIGLFKGCIGIFRFTNIKVKNDDFLLPISGSQLSKGRCLGGKFFNGKLISADEIEIPCTNVDIDVIDMVYDYDTIECKKIHATNEERYLRKEEICFILHNFLNKQLKRGNVKESKTIINSMYGVKVSNPVKDDFLILDGEIEVSHYHDYNIFGREKIYENWKNTQGLFGGNIDIYSDGVFVTSYARQQLLSKSIELIGFGAKVAYSDTDSIKWYADTIEDMKIIEEKIIKANEEKIKSNSKLLRFKQFRKLENLNDEEYAELCKLGIWEIEDEEPHKIFVTYGAKKYGYIDYKGEVHTTIAGCSKKKVPIVITNFAKANNCDLIKAFKFILSPGTTFDETASGRTTAYRETRDRSYFDKLTYQGRYINQYGGTIIHNTTYTLGVSNNDSKIIILDNDNLSIMSVDINGGIKYNE